MTDKPHAKYPHVFVVIRIDSYEELDAPFDEDRLAVTSVFETEEEAVADADRLNELAAARGARSRYITRVGRMRS